MANTKKKNYYYVLVMTSSGPKFVTKVNHRDKTAEWKEEEAPLELGKYMAEDICMGLNLNYHCAYTVHMPFEIESQPYRYNVAHIEWINNETGEKYE